MAHFKTEVLSGAAIDVLWSLFKHGPSWDGCLPSKTGRDQLVRLGMADRMDGWNWLTRDGIISALAYRFDRRKAVCR